MDLIVRPMLATARSGLGPLHNCSFLTDGLTNCRQIPLKFAFVGLFKCSVLPNLIQRHSSWLKFSVAVYFSRSACLPASVKKTVGLVVGSLASALGLVVLSLPAHAIVSCTGNNIFGSTATGSGNNCGVLPVGATFELDVTDFFAGLGTDSFDATQFGIGIVTSGQSQVAFSNVKAVVTGLAGFAPNNVFDSDPIAIWAQTLEPVVPDQPTLGQPNPAGSAESTNGFIYSATDGPIQPLNTFREISFAFTQTGEGQFGSFKASPDDIFLTKVDRFLITGTLSSVGTGDPLATNIISFGVGPAGRPDPGTTFGGFFTAAVPGPLPIAGAGAAFAWSRKLRRKQKIGTAG